MKKRIHINQHNIRKNAKEDTKLYPVITVKSYKDNFKGNEVYIDGPCRVVYSPDKPLACGAKVWIETDSQITIDP